MIKLRLVIDTLPSAGGVVVAILTEDKSLEQIEADAERNDSEAQLTVLLIDAIKAEIARAVGAEMRPANTH